ncbi:MAG TPA: geranylgeranylglyceryl/heptaprenylglyceryl phosphate synthase [Bacteroidales bacterium]|nr:geranylgeranylglyceryl/heptaprenylglyceryl phosphate synthase [Bacteroidales bacterium]
MSFYQKIAQNKADHKKMLGVLIDPDKYTNEMLNTVMDYAQQTSVSFFLIGGSLVSKNVNDTIHYIKEKSGLPVFLFPGNLLQLCDQADGILLLSLISGRNPEYLIGNHIHAAPFLGKSGMEIISTGYMLIDTGKRTSVEYISNTFPIPNNKPDIAVATAMAGEMLGMKLIYLEGGSGAQEPVNAKIISEVKNNISIPLIVGGGIQTASQASEIINAGADCIIVGNAIESNPKLLFDIAPYVS